MFKQIQFSSAACPDPTPTNGSAILYDSGQFAGISCDTGFTMVGGDFIECVNDTWSSNTTCQIVGKYYDASCIVHTIRTTRPLLRPHD